MITLTDPQAKLELLDTADLSHGPHIPPRTPSLDLVKLQRCSLTEPEGASQCCQPMWSPRNAGVHAFIIWANDTDKYITASARQRSACASFLRPLTAREVPCFQQ